MMNEINDLDFDRYYSKVCSDEKVFSFFFGISNDVKKADGRVYFGKKGIAVISRSEENEFSCDYYEFSKIKGANFYSYTSICFCEIEYCDELVRIFCTRGNMKQNVSQFVRLINEVCDGSLQPKDAVFIDKRTFCPKCGRPFNVASTVCPQCEKKSTSAKKIKEILSKHKLSIFLTTLFFIITIGCKLFIPMIQSYFVDNFLTADNPQEKLGDVGMIVLIIGGMTLTRLVLLGFFILRTNTFSKMSVSIITEIRNEVFSKIQQLSVAGISKRTEGDLINRVSSDTATLSFFLSNQFPSAIEQCLVLIFIGIIMAFKSWKLTLLVFMPLPAIAIVFKLASKTTEKYYHRQWVATSKAYTVLRDIFLGVRVVKVFGTEKNEIEKYDKAIALQRDISIKTEVMWSKIRPITEYFLKIGNFIVIYIAGKSILEGGGLTVGDLMLFTSYLSYVYEPMRWMASMPQMLQKVSTSVIKIFEIIDEEPDVADAQDPKNIDILGDIEVNNIYFGYNESENVLENVSLSVKPGEFLGIVGRSGCGKSTLINLIMRLYDVDKGSIKIDGIDVKEISQHCLRSQIGVVLQETFLFAGTIYENIAYAKPDATFDEVINASRLANAHDYIMKLPDGYNTKVGEHGYTISGGERQRIAIARAVLHDPKILILDEATSALDTETEKIVQDALQKLCKNRTTIAIAHRLSTLRNATKLIVIDKKKVAEMGTHDELMQQKGKYYELVMAQRKMSKLSK